MFHQFRCRRSHTVFHVLFCDVQAPEATWQHDMFADQPAAPFVPQAGRASSIETGTKLYISNLDYGVSNEDIKVLLYLISWWFELASLP